MNLQLHSPSPHHLPQPETGATRSCLFRSPIVFTTATPPTTIRSTWAIRWLSRSSPRHSGETGLHPGDGRYHPVACPHSRQH